MTSKRNAFHLNEFGVIVFAMQGPEIIVRSLSAQRIADSHGNHWQYHPQSDQHSKISCWAILFDLLLNCALVRKHIEDGKIGFGINHKMTDFTSGRPKDLDLVLSVPRTDSKSTSTSAISFESLVAEYAISLTPPETKLLSQLPKLSRRPVGDVVMALEAKAAMTAHGRAAPRLFDELTSAWQCINGSAEQAIAIGFGLVNAAPEFVSPKMNKQQVFEGLAVVNRENQPNAVEHVYRRIRNLKVRGHTTERGYDAIGVTTIMARNDGSPITLAPIPPALPSDDPLHYERMILRVAGIYTSRFLTL